MGRVIHIVDDDEAIRDSLSFLFNSRGFSVRDWASGEAFLEDQPLDDCACIILDVRMGELSGPEVYERLRASGNTVPVIFLTGHADIPIAVQSLKAGAFDFLEKPFNDNQIVDLTQRAMESYDAARAERATRQALAARRAALTPREGEVMALMMSGALNKQIADRLNISTRTVEAHRGKVLHKMGARNGIELAMMLATEDKAN